MYTLFFEEAVGKCECSNLANGGVCSSQKNLIRRVLSPLCGVIGRAHCERCMPDFFKLKKYSVVKALTSQKDDPLFSNYVDMYRRVFQTQ